MVVGHLGFPPTQPNRLQRPILESTEREGWTWTTLANENGKDGTISTLSLSLSAANSGEHREERERAGQLSCKQIIFIVQPTLSSTDRERGLDVDNSLANANAQDGTISMYIFIVIVGNQSRRAQKKGRERGLDNSLANEK